MEINPSGVKTPSIWRFFGPAEAAPLLQSTRSAIDKLWPVSLLAIGYCLLPVPHCLLPNAYCLLPIAYKYCTTICVHAGQS
jgi:hypothetical protein